ncbi:MAG: metallophosphoesterase [Myxococcales bacterium FL481]|nr:MAG: metallophosphoesterase [Myxococcales bacterium FL481]
MSRITHVCLSDMHFGAETSLLTDLSPDFRPEYQQPSPVLIQLIRCLREVVVGPPDAPRPKLVLAGDILELALARTHQAAMAFETFLCLAFPETEPDLFDREIIYVPGNHDHHLWETTREDHYLDYLNTVEPGARLGPQWHVTRLYRKQGQGWPTARVLTGLARRHPHLADLRVVTAYPNMGVRSCDGRRSVIVTHGHYIESLYTLLSDIKTLVFPEEAPPSTVIQLEAENFAWIDFFWSTMGRSGDAGDRVQQIYEMIGTEEGTQRLSERLAAGVVARFLPDNWIPDSAERFALSKLIELVAERVKNRERGDAGGVLSDAAHAGLLDYVAGPLRRQIEHECRHSCRPDDVSLVFGHTHKPFESQATIDGFRESGVGLLNTGGWVVDTVDRQPLHGAAVVVVDEDLEVASLRLYNEVPDGEDPPVVRVCSAAPNALQARLDGLVDPQREPWSSFVEVTHAAIECRAEALARRAGVRAPS